MYNSVARKHVAHGLVGGQDIMTGKDLEDLKADQRRWGRIFLSAVLAISAGLLTGRANATITQGDFSIFGTLSSRWSGRWGEDSSNSIPCRGTACVSVYATNPTHYTGGSYDFNHWDLVQARQVADLRPDYHTVKNYQLFGRFDTLFIKDADLFAIYRPWYDAFGDIKQHGTAPPALGWLEFDNTAKKQYFYRDDLREYYSQLTFTDNFSARIGKQQVIWSEADALSGSDITNPNDLSYHWTHFEAPEDLRRNLRMIKLNYILPDFLKTANNEFDGFVIPGDWEGGASIVATDPRRPYVAHVPIGQTQFTTQGIPVNLTALNQNEEARHAYAVPGTTALLAIPEYQPTQAVTKKPSNSLDNSEFGVRYSSLLPIGNGLQASLIYLYEARNGKTVWNMNANNCPPAAFLANPSGVIPGSVQPGICLQTAPILPPSQPPFVTVASATLNTNTYYTRSHFVGLTGTYYDKDLTDIVYRYDFSWQNKAYVATDCGVKNLSGDCGLGFPLLPISAAGPYARFFPAGTTSFFTSGGKWTDQTRWIVAADRPTYIPWISKQHTFFTAQYVATWYPDLPHHAVPYIGSRGKVRTISNFVFLNAVNWLMNGQLVTSNGPAWDIDDNVGEVTSTNTYRYSRNVILALNAIWYVGRSMRYTDPFVFSGNQDMNEVEFRFTYEI
jgi:hypothetical protein